MSGFFHVFTFLCLISTTYSRDFELFQYEVKLKCQSGFIFDSATLKCFSCPFNQVANSDQTECVCMAGFRKTGVGRDLKCEECPPFHVTSENDRSCLPCGIGLTYNGNTKRCDPCSTNEIVINAARNGTGLGSVECHTCSVDTVKQNVNLCVPCHESYYIATGGNCSCPEFTHSVLGGMCIPLSELTQISDRLSSHTIEYETGDKVISAYFETNFRSIAHSCSVLHNVTACQSLANMCVLLHYGHDSDINACSYYRTNFGRGFQSLPDYVPWLYYPEAEASIYLSKGKIKTQFSFNPKKHNSKLNFVVAKYSLEGQLLGYGSAKELLNHFCPAITSSLERAFTFGTTFFQSCLMNADDLWDKQSNEFYDLFLKVAEGDDKLYAVPILNQNYAETRSFVNKLNLNRWQLTRRIYLLDNVSGKESIASSRSPDNSGRARVVRYAREIEVIVKLQAGEDAGQIYPPLVKILYEELSDREYGLGNRIKTSLKVTYHMEFDRIHEDLSIAIGVLSALAVLWSLGQTWGWSKRSGRLGLDVPSILHFLLCNCGNLANVFFCVMFFSCFYWMVFYKRQDVVLLFLPTGDQELIVKQFLISAFVLKFAQLIYMIYIQVTVDLFIIDWEQPMARNTLPHPQLPSEDERPQSDVEKPVSIWRTYFIANEWNELQTLRKARIDLTLFAVLFFLKIVGFENLATADPRGRFRYEEGEFEAPHSYVCRFGVSVAVYFVVIAIQWIFVSVFYERYIENNLQQFVDLCSMANVSIFILEHHMYGYYIHGRSVHGFADVNLKSFYEQLQREEEDLCGHRGLEPASEVQTFEVFVTGKFRHQYEAILLPVRTMFGLHRPTNRGNKMATVQIEQGVQAYERMKYFFSMFLQHALKDIDYLVKEKLLLESVLNVELQEPEEKCLLFRCENNPFDRVLFTGQESLLVLFEILLFTFVDLLSHNFTLAATITFLASHICKVIRNKLGRRNVAQKTLVDQRFLI